MRINSSIGAAAFLCLLGGAAVAQPQAGQKAGEPLPAATPLKAVNPPLATTAPQATASAAELVSPDGIQVAGWDAGATVVPSAATAWGGERPSFEGEPLSQRVASYALTAVLDPVKHTVEGTEQLSWLNRSDRPVRSLYFHLYLNGFESQGSTFNVEGAHYGEFRSGVQTKKGEYGYTELKSATQAGRSATWQFVHPDGGPAADHSVIRLDLPEPVAPGATAILDLSFHDQLPRVVARTGYFGQFHMVAQWFPKIGVLELAGERGATAPRWNCHEFHFHSEFYADFGNYQAVITAPADYLVRATGAEQGAPVQTPQGLQHRFVQDDVHDFVFTAWNQYAKPLVGHYDGPGSPHVEVEVLYPAEYRQAAELALQATIDSLGYFSKTLGPYPYRHLTCVVPPFNAEEAGGMEYETFFATIGARDPAFMPFVRYVTIHEFGHGYYMGLLATNEFEEPFLDEGMNEFWDNRMLSPEHIDVSLPKLVKAAGISVPPVSWWDFERLGGTQRFQADPIAGNSWDRYSSGSYGLVYSRTVLVFHDLEARLGTEAFARGMKLYYRRWHHRHPGTADLRAALAEGTGNAEVVNAWFDEQVYANGPVDDRVTEVTSEEVVPQPGLTLRDGKSVEVDEDAVKKDIEVTRAAWKKAHPDKDDKNAKDDKKAKVGPYPFSSAVTARRFAAHVPQTLVVKFEDGSEERLDFPESERWHRWLFVRPVRVASAQLDPQRKSLLDLNKLDDGRTREASRLAASRWTLELGAFLSLALSLLVTQ